MAETKSLSDLFAMLCEAHKRMASPSRSDSIMRHLHDAKAYQFKRSETYFTHFQTIMRLINEWALEKHGDETSVLALDDQLTTNALTVLRQYHADLLLLNPIVNITTLLAKAREILEAHSKDTEKYGNLRTHNRARRLLQRYVARRVEESLQHVGQWQ
jgi:hypothetical protein